MVINYSGNGDCVRRVGVVRVESTDLISSYVEEFILSFFVV